MINKDCIIVFNKSDLNIKIPKNEFKKNDQILISAKKNKNIDVLIKLIKNKLSTKFMKNNIIGIIPARMASSRLPGKPLKQISGIPMIGHVYLRSKLSKNLNSDSYL